MKHLNLIMVILLLVLSTACSKEAEKTQPEPAKNAATDVIKNELTRIDDAKKALDDSKKVNQMIMDSAAQQRETIEKTQQ